MKLIALKNFARVGDLKQVAFEGLLHEGHIHKGTIFEIGRANKLKDLGGSEKVLVAQLTVAECVGDATDPNVVAAVQAEVAAETKAEPKAKGK